MIKSDGALLFGAQNPGHPWWSIAEQITEALVGFGKPLLPRLRAAVVTPADLQGARNNPIEVAAGDLTIGITTPSVTAKMALEGTGIFDHSHDGLRAIASYPHNDFLVFMVDAGTGITSLDQLVVESYPLRLVTGRRSEAGVADVLTFTIEEILRCYGITYETIAEWGGEVIYGGPTHIGGFLMLDGEANALFQEARNSPVWFKIAESRPVNLLAVSEQARRHMHDTYGFAEREIPAGHYPGQEEAVPTVDFSGWLVFVRSDLPDEIAYAIARACDETRTAVDGTAELRRSLDLPVDPVYLFNETVIPLHPGAAAYARERGCLRAGQAA